MCWLRITESNYRGNLNEGTEKSVQFMEVSNYRNPSVIFNLCISCVNGLFIPVLICVNGNNRRVHRYTDQSTAMDYGFG